MSTVLKVDYLACGAHGVEVYHKSVKMKHSVDATLSL